MAIPLHVFMRDLLSHNVGGDFADCRQVHVALVMDNATNPQNRFRSIETSSCERMDNFESRTPRAYPRWTRMSLVENNNNHKQTSCMDLSDHSKGISRWGAPNPTGGNSNRFDSGMPLTNNPEVPPVAPPRMMSPAVATGSRKKGLHMAIDISPSKEASLMKYKDQHYEKRYNVHQLRQDGLTRKHLTCAVERALQICDTRPHQSQ